MSFVSWEKDGVANFIIIIFRPIKRKGRSDSIHSLAMHKEPDKLSAEGESYP